MLPCGTGRATLIRVGAQKVGGDLLIIVIEQGGLRPEKGPDKVGAGGEAYVVLGASGVSQQEWPVPRRHLETGGHGRWCDRVGIQPLRQHGEASAGDGSDVHRPLEARGGLRRLCMEMLHTILLFPHEYGTEHAVYGTHPLSITQSGAFWLPSI